MPIPHHQDYVRLLPGGAGQSGATATYKRELDNSTITTATADSNGYYEKSLADTATTGESSYVLHPGPFYVEVVIGSYIRRSSSRATGSTGPLSLPALLFSSHEAGTGVLRNPGYGLNDLAVTGEGSSRAVVVDTGAFVVEGIAGFNDAARTLTIGANSSGSTRIDTIVLEVVPAGEDEEGKITLTVVEGTTSPPSLQQDSELYQFPLADVSVANGASVITTANVTDRRVWPPTRPIGSPLSARYRFSTTTSAGDPGTGIANLNNATQSSATLVRLDLTDADGTDVTGILDELGEGTSAVKGMLRIESQADATRWIVFSVTLRNTASGYRSYNVSVVAASTTNPFSNGESIAISYVPTGDKGQAGAGSGDVVGPGTHSNNGLVLFDGANSNEIKQATGSGIVSVASGAASVTGGSGNVALDSGALSVQPYDRLIAYHQATYNPPSLNAGSATTADFSMTLVAGVSAIETTDRIEFYHSGLVQPTFSGGPTSSPLVVGAIRVGNSTVRLHFRNVSSTMNGVDAPSATLMIRVYRLVS